MDTEADIIVSDIDVDQYRAENGDDTSNEEFESAPAPGALEDFQFDSVSPRK